MSWDAAGVGLAWFAGHFTASFVFISVRLLESAVASRQWSSFSDRVEATAAALLSMLLQLVPQSARLFPRVLFIPEASSAILIALVRVLYVCRCVVILVVFESAVLGLSSVMCIEVEAGAVRDILVYIT